MDENKNPYIEPENYFDGYKESIEKLKERPEFVEFDKLCHLVFGTPDGQHLMKELEKRFLINSLCSPNVPNYQTLVIYTEGFRDAIRQLRNSVLSHEQRIKAENTPK